jgi:hypothetical protein
MKVNENNQVNESQCKLMEAGEKPTKVNGNCKKLIKVNES